MRQKMSFSVNLADLRNEILDRPTAGMRSLTTPTKKKVAQHTARIDHQKNLADEELHDINRKLERAKKGEAEAAEVLDAYLHKKRANAARLRAKGVAPSAVRHDHDSVARRLASRISAARRVVADRETDVVKWRKKWRSANSMHAALSAARDARGASSVVGTAEESMLFLRHVDEEAKRLDAALDQSRDVQNAGKDIVARLAENDREILDDDHNEGEDGLREHFDEKEAKMESEARRAEMRREFEKKQELLRESMPNDGFGGGEYDRYDVASIIGEFSSEEDQFELDAQLPHVPHNIDRKPLRRGKSIVTRTRTAAAVGSGGGYGNGGGRNGTDDRAMENVIRRAFPDEYVSASPTAKDYDDDDDDDSGGPPSGAAMALASPPPRPRKKKARSGGAKEKKRMELVKDGTGRVTNPLYQI